MRELVLNATEVGHTLETEYRLSLPGGVIRFEKADINVTRLIDIDALVQVTIFTDITEQKVAMDKLRFLNGTARDIIAQTNVENAIGKTLIKINGYFTADRSYVVELDDTRQVSSNTYEVCANGIEPQKAGLQQVAYTQDDFWYDALNRQGHLIIESVEKLDDEQIDLRKMLLRQNIHSLIIVALRRDGELIGFAGADNPKSAIDQVLQLTGIADNLSMLLTRRDMARKTAHDNGIMQVLMNDAPGGFLRMQVFTDRNPAIISFNAGLCRMLDMTGDEVRAAYGDDAFNLLSAEDIAATSEESADAFAACGQ